MPKERIHISMERNMRCGVGHCGHCQLGPVLICRDGARVLPPDATRWSALMEVRGAVERPSRPKPKLAVWKFSSCDGCQLTLLDCEDELLAIAGELEIAYFPEATKAELDGPYDVSLVEGSITTRARRRADPRDPRAVAAARHDRRLRDRPAASRRSATSPT